MNVALLNPKGGVGKTTLALHLAGEWARVKYAFHSVAHQRREPLAPNFPQSDGDPR
jgi:hypothetical protein